MTRRYFIRGVVLGCALVSSTALAEVHSNLARGFAPERLYDHGGIDSINLFNGGLTLTIPIGGSFPVNGNLSYSLSLVYNSKIWEYEWLSNQSGKYLHAYPNRGSNAGLGWSLSLGELLQPSSPRNKTLLWVYVSPDGAQHTFYDTVTLTQSASPGVCYTRDSSYLRLKGVNGCTGSIATTVVIKFPDGNMHAFQKAGGEWRLEEIRDRFNNVVDIQYPSSNLVEVVDPHRRQKIYFESTQSGRRVWKVELTSAGGTATYKLRYSETTLLRSCKDYESPSYVDVALLDEIELPDLSLYKVESYETQCPVPSGSEAPGVIKLLRLPTGGKIGFTYADLNYNERYTCAPDIPQCVDEWRTTTGVASKTIYSPAGAALGTWTYAHTVGTFPNYDRKVVVRTPLNDETVNWFVENDIGWEYGLPMRKSVVDGGRYLSQEFFDGFVSSNPKRSTYLKYERDAFQSPVESMKRRVSSQSTKYHDDGQRVAAVDYSNFDDVGHYKLSTTSGTFDSGNSRTQTIDYGGLPAAWNPWNLNGFWSDHIASDATATQYLNCFDTFGTGVLMRRRFLKTNGQVQNTDVLVEYVRDAVGNVISERYYGGDTNPIPDSPNFCTQTIGAPSYPPTYQIDNSYQFGALKTSQHSGANFLDVNYTLDPGTGLPLTSRDTASVQTIFNYDTLNRLTAVKPSQDAWTFYNYSRAQGTGTASVTVRSYPNGTAVGQLTDEEVIFDGFGRVAKERRRMAGNSWSKRLFGYNAMGWRTFAAEWSPDSTPDPQLPSTKFQGYDPFGRPDTIEPPDGPAHSIGLTYAGVRVVNRKTKIATMFDTNGTTILETDSTTTERYDRLGRLWQVTEPSGAAGANVTTTYGYDSANRLTSVSTTSGVTQTRNFNYDGRGFLRWENHPEKTANAFGQGHDVDYDLYDARGHAGRKYDGDNDLRFSYDSAERLRQVATPARVYKVFTYGTGTSSGDRSLGKLKIAERYNYPVLGTTTHTSLVRDTYTYAGLEGRVSARQTTHLFNAIASETWNVSQSYNELGGVVSLNYPDCSFTACTSAPRTVQYGYSNGYTTSVTGYASSITYAPNGMLASVSHTNGVVDYWSPDPSGMPRPNQIYSFTNGGTFGQFTTGFYEYDGIGNVKKIGNSSFLYDPVSRIKSASVRPWFYSDGNPENQTYSYDAFGNLSISTRPVTYNSSTNRLQGSSYDAAGNLTAWNGQNYQYDPLGMMTRFCSSTPCPGAAGEEWLYMYNADDERIWSFKVGAAPRFDRWALRGLDGKVLREYANSGYTFGTKTDYIFRDGSPLAAQSPTGLQTFSIDHLGTVRLITDPAGNPANARIHTYMPFGEETALTFASYNYNNDTRLRFTGHERDISNASGQADDLDYMHARHHSPLTGRFLSFDPAGGIPKKPQSWNRYAYGLGNPVRYVDPTGELSVSSMVNVITTAAADFSQQVSYSCASQSLFGLACATTALNVNDMLNLAVDPLKAGDALGTAMGSGAGVGDTLLALGQDALRTTAVLTPVVAAGRSLIARSMVEVVHFTDDAGRAAIQASGNLRAGTYVTKPAEVRGLSASQIEQRLEIQAGRGTNSFTFRVRRGDLAVPENGARTSGGAYQRQLKNPCDVTRASCS